MFRFLKKAKKASEDMIALLTARKDEQSYIFP